MTTVRTAYQDFLEACEADGLAETTMTWYRSLLTPFVDEWGHSLIKTISVKDIRKYLIRIRRKYEKEHTINDHNRALHRFWKWVHEEYAIPNPMRRIAYPKKPNPNPNPIRIEHVAALFGATRDNEYGIRDRAIIAWLLDTGARAGGTITVRVSDIDFTRRRVVITEKGSKTRMVTFTEFTERFLKAWIAVRKPEVKTLFYNLQELTPLTTSGLRQILKRLRRRAKIETRIYTHMFRHGFAQNYLMNGGDLASLFRLMGHADPSTTVWYYTIFTEGELAQLHEEFSPIRQLEAEIQKPSFEG